MMTKSRSARTMTAVALLAAALLAGCSGASRGETAAGGPTHDPAWQRLHASKKQALKPQNKFEASKDPAITAATYYASGQLAESRSLYTQAADQYRKALKLEPKHQASMYRLGVTYAVLKRYPDALDVWERYLKVTGESAEAYSNLGFCYELSGQPAQAEAAYLKGIGRDAKNAACRVNYGLMLARQNKTNEATLQLQAVLSKPEVHYNLASVYETQGRKEQAKLEYQKALQLAPEFKDAQARLDALD